MQIIQHHTERSLDTNRGIQPTSARLQQHPLAALDPIATRVRCRAGQQIHQSAGPADHWYRVVSGAARRCAFFADGRRQIVAFLFPGDLFGFSSTGAYDFWVEAITDRTSLALYPNAAVEQLITSDAVVAEELRRLVLESLVRMEGRLLALGRMTALERVGAFLLDLADRLGPVAPHGVTLPMRRHDIADYLALSGETVSRTLTILRQRGAIALPTTHEVQIVDRRALVPRL
jgi:CRP/FNR family transcriptional regulator, nitrogen fixation regulation protein